MNNKSYEKRISELQRYSFLNTSGGVTRVKDNCGNWIEQHEAAQIAEAADIAIKELQEQLELAKKNVWQQAIDEQLVAAHLGIAGDVTLEQARKALHDLIDWNIAVEKLVDPSTPS